jgi:alpha,alpha-trehalose phosphorylase
MHDDGPSANPAQAETLFAIANGAIGVRGGREEQPSPSDGAFLSAVYDRVPIFYHEGFPGFARFSDTRVPVADGKRIRVRLGADAQDLSQGRRISCQRTLDLQHGLLHRRTVWEAPDGGRIEVRVTRFVPMSGGPLLVLRFSIRSIDFRGPVSFESCIETTAAAVRAEDPRIGAGLGAGLVVGERRIVDDCALLTQLAPHSEIQVVTAQTHRVDTHFTGAAPALTEYNSVGQRYSAVLSPGAQLTLDKFVTWSVGTDPKILGREAAAAVHAAAVRGCDSLEREHRMEWSGFWELASLGIDGDPSLDQALNFSLFHVRQSTPGDGKHALSAKGLTGQGYEGHVFWDTEVFALPVLEMTAPHLVRASLDWRTGTLAAARAHAREMNHPIGALYPWRTIAGDEGSGYFPSGSAQYHINAAVAFALRLHHLGAGGTQPLARADAAMLFETARIWMQIGHFNPARSGAFCIHAVTGPDEYAALVDNDCYTNRMARMHLLFAADAAAQLERQAPEIFRALAAELDLLDSEPRVWRRAAEAMYLPVDARLGVQPQDDGFLARPLWNFATEPSDHRPLLLRFHPLTLYRHQVCKQPSVVLADVLVGDGIDAAQKRRDFDYYEPLTVHDSSLSESTWAILAAELGLTGRALDYFRVTARLDLDDLHGNASHGAHMAAMAGTWLGLVWGFGGLRIGDDGTLRLRPTLPPDWRGYHFSLHWQGRVVRVDVSPAGVKYRLRRGSALAIVHDGEQIMLSCEPVRRPLPSAVPAAAARRIEAVIFDLDGVLTDTAELHYRAWGRLAEEIGVAFDRKTNERLKGVDRATSLDIILERATRPIDAAGRAALAARKNGYFVASLARLTPDAMLPGALRALDDARARGAKIALASASHNARAIIAQLGIADRFDYIADPGGGSRPKPAPDLFLAAAAALGAEPAHCVAVEDAIAGVAAIKAAGMFAIGIGDPRGLVDADVVVPDMVSLHLQRFL